MRCDLIQENVSSAEKLNKVEQQTLQNKSNEKINLLFYTMSLYTIFSHHLLKSISLKSFVQERKPKRVYQTMKEDFRYHFSKKDYKYVLTLSTTFSFPGSCPKVSFEGLAITDNETSKRLNTYQQVLFLFLPQFPL